MNVVVESVHGDKLNALEQNPKLPAADLPRVGAHIAKYEAWVDGMDKLDADGDELLECLVELLNAYKKSVEFDLIFCSDANFLQCQKGQLKLDNTVLEEFLPRLFAKAQILPSQPPSTGLS